MAYVHEVCHVRFLCTCLHRDVCFICNGGTDFWAKRTRVYRTIHHTSECDMVHGNTYGFCHFAYCGRIDFWKPLVCRHVWITTKDLQHDMSRHSELRCAAGLGRT